MANSVKGIPDSSSVVIPRLFCRDPAAAIDFCKHTFNAAELGRRLGPDGSVVHALLMIGPAMIMIEGEWPTLKTRAPRMDASSPVVIFVYVEDVDDTLEKGIATGAELLIPAQDQFWGDRTAWFMDPSGHVWTIATRIEETSRQERNERWADIIEGQKDQ